MIVTSHSSFFVIDHHYKTPVDALLPVAQVTMFLAVVCSVMMGISRRLGDFLMKMLTINLRIAFEQTRKPEEGPTLLQQDILSGLPKTIETALSQFDLDVKTTVYAVCEVCHCTYAP
ncbi:hypothetical protein HYPSUDRAFT_145129, partial [Hypholoma sublateritium FD-334 SS-4]